jgi:hypothetical protein
MRGRSLLEIAALWSLAHYGMACATAARSTKPGDATASPALAYYPLFLGWGWAYEVERDGTNVLSPYLVVERGEDFAVVRNGEQTIEYAILFGGIAKREKGVPGDFLLKSPTVVGAEWPVTGGVARILERKDSATFSSGTYRDCIVVEEVRRDPDRATRTTYCRDIGPVELEMRVQSPLSRAYDTVILAKLLSVTRPEP